MFLSLLSLLVFTKQQQLEYLYSQSGKGYIGYDRVTPNVELLLKDALKGCQDWKTEELTRTGGVIIWPFETNEPKLVIVASADDRTFLSENSNNDNKIWQILRVPGKSYKLKNNNKCLSIENKKIVSKKCTTRNKDPYQYWNLKPWETQFETPIDVNVKQKVKLAFLS